MQMTELLQGNVGPWSVLFVQINLSGFRVSRISSHSVSFDIHLSWRVFFWMVTVRLLQRFFILLPKKFDFLFSCDKRTATAVVSPKDTTWAGVWPAFGEYNSFRARCGSRLSTHTFQRMSSLRTRVPSWWTVWPKKPIKTRALSLKTTVHSRLQY